MDRMAGERNCDYPSRIGSMISTPWRVRRWLPEAFVLLVAAASPAGLAGQEEVNWEHRIDGVPSGRSSIRFGPEGMVGEYRGGDLLVEARLLMGRGGKVEIYRRSVRRQADGLLIHQIELEREPEADRYRGRERQGLGSRHFTVSGELDGILDASWPEGLLRLFLDHDGGRVQVLRLPEGTREPAEILPREKGARFLAAGTTGATYLPGEGGPPSLVLGGPPDRVLAPPAGAALPGPAVRAEEGGWLRPAGFGRDAGRPAVILIPDPVATDQAPHEALLLDLAERVVLPRGWAARLVRLGEPGGLPSAVAQAGRAFEETRSAEGVDPGRIAAIGTGHAAVVLARFSAAPAAGRLRGIVGLGAPARPASEGLVAAMAERSRSRGASPGQIAEATRVLEADIERLRSAEAGALDAQRELLRDLLYLSPVDAYLAAPERILLLHGDQDLQVPYYHRALLGTSLGVRGTSLQEIRTLPGADGFFRKSTGSAARDLVPGDVSRPRSPELVAAVQDFLDRLFGGPVK